LKIEFKGLSEEDILIMQGHRVKDTMKRLNEYKKKNPQTCPLMAGK